MSTHSILTRPNSIIAFPHRKHKDRSWQKMREQHTMSPGILSPNARIKMRRGIKWLIASAEWKQVYEKRFKKMVDWRINMATLTFKENLEDDNLARKILSQWFEVAKYRWNISSYLWRAEPQERGAIHFHVAFNQYIPHQELKYTWNRTLRKHGLTNTTDNGTDIHAVVDCNNLEAYLTEYMMDEKKHAGRRNITGKLWGCSHNLSQAGKEKILIDKDELTILREELKQYNLWSRLKAEGKHTPEFLDIIDVWIVNEKFWETLPPCQIKDIYTTEIKKLNPTVKQQQLYAMQ